MNGTMLEDAPAHSQPRPARPTRLLAVGATIAILAFAMGAGCFAWLGQRSAGATAAQAADKTSEANARADSPCSATVASASWAGEGARLIALKAVKAPAGSGIVNAGPWAYQSAPINVSANGNYVLQFTVPAGFHPGGMGFDFPPGMGFDVHPVGGWTSTATGAGKTIHMPVVVTGFQQPCMAFSVWIA